MTSDKSNRRLVPNTEYARLIGVTPRTIWNMENSGRLSRPLRINGRKYRDPNELPASDVGVEVIQAEVPIAAAPIMHIAVHRDHGFQLDVNADSVAT